MSAFELDDSGVRYVDELAASKGVPLGTPVDAGFFTGAAGAPLKGLMRGIVAKPAKLIGDATTPVIRPMARAIDSAFGTNAVSNYFEGELRKNNQLLDDLKADPATTGMAGQLLHGLFDIGSSALLFSPEGAAVMEGYSRQQELIGQGVDSTTATAAGTVSGAALFAGVKAPMTMGAAAAGRGVQGLAANVAVGAGTNLAAGIMERGLTHDLLDRAGYKDMAAQYKPYDTQAMMTEITLGTIFSGGFGAMEARAAKRQAALDAALTVNNALHASRGTAPGAPVDAKSSAAHQTALEAAVDQLMRGEPVNVADAVSEAEFIRPKSPGDSPAGAAIRDAYHDVLPAVARHVPSDRLVHIPIEQRRGLRYDAPELNEFAASVEQKYGLPGGLINALKNAGEKSGSNATSPKGARGVMQFMPDNLKKYGVTDPSDPAQLIDAAGRYLRDTMQQYGGNVDAVIADYNGGPRQARRVLNGEAPAAAETRAYLTRVKEYLGRDGETARLAKQPTAEQFAESVGRVAEVSQETRAPTFSDGTAYTGEQIVPFYEQMIAGRAAGAAVPDVHFRIGHIDDQVAAGLQQILPSFEGAARDAQISSHVIAQIQQLKPTVVREVLSRLADNALYADEVLPNPEHPDRALLVLSDGVHGNKNATVLDVAAGETGIQVMSSTVTPQRNLKAAREMKAQIEASRQKEQPQGRADSAPAVEPHGTKPSAAAPDQSTGAQNDAGSMDVGATRSNATEAEITRSSPETSSQGQIPEVQTAHAIADELPDLLITLDDGTTITAREALAQADDTIAQAKNDSRAFEAAITCFLRNG